MEDIAQFGKPLKGLEPTDRPGAYGVAVSDGKVLVVRWRGELYLPGGGIEEGETPESALRREVLEETGCEVLSLVPLGSARQLTMDRSHERYFNKLCAFFRITVAEATQAPIDAEHVPLWIPAFEAAHAVYEQASGWAISKVAFE